MLSDGILHSLISLEISLWEIQNATFLIYLMCIVLSLWLEEFL